MNVQTSLEFLLILSAVAVLSLCVLSFYGKTLAFDRLAPSAFAAANFSNAGNSNSAAAEPGIAINVPVNSLSLSGNPILVESFGCGAGTEKITLNATGIIFSQNSILANFTGLALKYVYFDPENTGMHSIGIAYSIKCNKTIISGERSYLTYSSPSVSAVQQAGEAGVSIKYAKENLLYAARSFSINRLQGSTLCTERNIWTGSIYPPNVQCGTGASWDYMVFDGSCEAPDWSYSRTYCFVPEPSGYDAIIPEAGNVSYAYNITLSIDTSYGIISANLSSSNHISPVMFSGREIGNATVESVTASLFSPPAMIQSPNLRINASGRYPYYANAERAAYQVLHFYNSTGVSSSVSSSVQEAVSAANSEEKNLIGNPAPQTQGPCTYAAHTYKCKALSPFSYVINITANAGPGIGNLTVPYYGSVINIKEK